MPNFSIDCYHNEYRPAGAGDLDAILTVAATETGATARGPESSDRPGCVVIMIDVSGSMGGDRIRQARKATAAAISCLHDGMQFAVIAGNETARPVYPQFGLAVATPESRSAAAKEVSKLNSGGGTRIGRWIRAATQLLANEPGPRQAILLTDGKNENETAQDLDDAVSSAVGVFQCDCRGVGTDWVVPELRKISQALLGSLDLVAQPSALTADFEKMIRSATSKGVAEMALRVWAPEGASVAMKEVSPNRTPLAGQPVPGNPNTIDFLTGAWGDESRDYQLTVRMKPAGVGDKMLAARVTVLVDGAILLAGERAVQRLVQVEWTDDVVLSTRINKEVAHYKGHGELAENVEAGLKALEDGDATTAAVRMGRAVALATELGDKDMSARLSKIVEIEDPSTGVVRLKNKVEKVDLMDIDVQTTKTSPVRR
jgi:hypothetical protein